MMMIIGIAQISPCWNEPEKTFRKIRDIVEEAVEADANLIAFPEQIVTGWDPKDPISYVQNESGEIVIELYEIAREYGIGLLGSYREADEPRPKNTALLIGTDGRIIARYSKIHLFSPADEDKYYTPGSNLGIAEFEGCRCGIAICYDLRFGSLFRLYRDAGVDLVLVPSAWPASRQKLFNTFVACRAAEFQIWVAGINTVGITPVDSYSGGSCLVGPDGSVSVEAGDREEILFGDVNPAESREIQRSFPVKKDERCELYKRLRD